ncbi:MAG: HAMP domain-containing histidine kinase [Spirochaetia bacterium]|nr:HAMP domain-containing histidine kinase [Spirochaetia bacterium]
MILFRFVQAVLILGFSAGILFLGYSWIQYLRARRAQKSLLQRMVSPIPPGNRAAMFQFVFAPLLYLEFELGRDLILVEKRFSIGGRKLIGNSAESIIEMLEPVLSEWIRSDLPLAAIPSDIMRKARLGKHSIVLFNLSNKTDVRRRIVLLLLSEKLLPSLEALSSFVRGNLKENVQPSVQQTMVARQQAPDHFQKHSGHPFDDSRRSAQRTKRRDLSRRALLAEAELESRRLAMLQIAHDIRIPVSALRLIRANLVAQWETIRSNLPAPEVHMDGLIGRLGKQLTNLELFASSYLDLELADKLHSTDQVATDAIDLGVLWLELLDAHAEEMKSKRLQLKLDGKWEGHVVLGVRNSIVRILENILSNALKFSRSGGTLWTGVKTDEHACVLELEDCGPGMTADAEGIQFDLAKKNLGPGGTGYGLGLAAARRLAERMLGSLLSVPPLRGSGARFLLVLPRKPE